MSMSIAVSCEEIPNRICNWFLVVRVAWGQSWLENSSWWLVIGDCWRLVLVASWLALVVCNWPWLVVG